MKLLQQKLQEIRSREFKKPALMTHVVLGYPSLKKNIDTPFCASASLRLYLSQLRKNRRDTEIQRRREENR